MNRMLGWLILIMLLMSCLTGAFAENGTESTLYVKKVEGLADDFILGMDISSVISLENSGVVYRDGDGQAADLFDLLQGAGINYIRVRVWNDPFTADGNGYGGGNCDLQNAILIGRRAAEHGMKLLVDFHYSDFWADPGKQMVPKAWAGLTVEEKAKALYAYTLESLKALREGGADVGMVQIGNETNGRFCGEKIWMNIIWHLMAAGCRAVREFDPEVKIAIHFANPENTDAILNWVSKLNYYSLDYDVLGVSYYPWWHGTLENLTQVLSTIRQTYGKDVMVAETSYAWTLEDTDFSGNTIGEGGAYELPYPISLQGQVNAVRDVTQAVCDAGGIGLFYWEGAWISVGTSSWEKNHEKWETFGSGWASSCAAEYDPADAGKYYGGSAVDNQTFFDAEGKALESLKVFRLMREGNEIAAVPEMIEDAQVSVDLGKEIVLPEKVQAVLNDGSRAEVPVVWDIPAGGLDSTRERTFEVIGLAEGLEARCTVKVSRFNYARNPSFEEEDLSMWRCEDLSQAQELYCEDKKTDSLTGTRHWHFYSASAATVHFTLEQDVSLDAGNYEYSISMMGGDAGNQEIFSYVKVNGEIVAREDTRITSWNNWFTPVIHFACEAGQTVTCGIDVRCDGAGAWGKIDDMVVVTDAARDTTKDTQHLVFYEIFTGSFSDSDGDGVGDLQGVLNRLDYLNDGNPESETSLGIQGIWLTPVFSSPSYHKYDVSDYYSVDPQFGTLADLQALIDGCHQRGIRLILDLPLNHTSTEHIWFQRFVNARKLHNEASPWYDIYICHEADSLPAGHTCYAIAGTEFSYEGNFSGSMPELNYDNETVRQAALEIAKFYLNMGVDGFRFDAAKYLYYGDHAQSAAFWEWYTGELRALSPDIWLVAEVWDSDSVTDQYEPAMNCFDFTMSGADGLIAQTAAAGDVNRYAAYVQSYQEAVQSLRKDAFLVPFISNHDMDRAAGYLQDSNGRIRMAANLYILGPGAPFIYYGEEIGLRGSRGGASTDANRRLAMRWGDGDMVADPQGATYDKQTDATVASMMEQSGSLFHYYRRLIALRKAHPEIAGGTCQAIALQDTKLGGFIFTGADSEIAVLHNSTQRILTLNLAETGLERFDTVSGYIGSGFVTLEDGMVTIEAQTSVILK